MDRFFTEAQVTPLSVPSLPCCLCAWPNGEPAPLTVCVSGLESRAQLVMTCSAPRVCLPASSCWGWGHVQGKSLGEVGAAATPSHVWALFSVVVAAQFPI